MHRVNDATVDLREAIFAYARTRLNYEPAPLDNTASPELLWQQAGQTITEDGLGGLEALKIFEQVLAPATISTDHPGYLSFIPCAPTEASKLFDLVVSASGIYGGSWLEGAGAVYAENQVLSWLAKEAGLPAESGGVFVQGGTLGNLSALVAARENYRQQLLKSGQPLPNRFAVACSSEAHSSLKTAARVMDIDLLPIPVAADGRIGHAEVSAMLTTKPSGLFAIVATGGTTNFGIVDRLDEIGQLAKAHNLWFHVDGAYGLAGMLSPLTRNLFAGLELADSFIVDPHKWLFAPFDACALIYRNPEIARAAHAQHGEYLDTLTDSGDFNPSDYAINLTRRPRGLPLWFSLATHGVATYREAVTKNIELAKFARDEIVKRDFLTLVREPELSVVVFERNGWTLADYEAWSDRLLNNQIAFVVPSSHAGRPNARFAIVNPLTSQELIVDILNSMEDK
ncbi:pyridoxal phosphate-dependent decarboxylase family protein [Candidatus Rhodoluna planktonica]|uniref:Glutamate decarboxylase n=1 Tax=Candidatus Rhodoluna planktonica TaxID=535712 RepID=A0A1D9DYN3_9MICO|nr:aminotransferase class V-fold PLP-dependent enzyme [Candidatus Rhodoluna planktonica]AOY55900.1 glutamate decarboxylase [Candidatus Rhodoluna planktonica]